MPVNDATLSALVHSYDGLTQRVDGIAATVDALLASASPGGYLDLKLDCGLKIDGVLSGGTWTGTDDSDALLAACVRARLENKTLLHPGGNLVLAKPVNGQAPGASVHGYLRLHGTDRRLCKVIQGGNPATLGSAVYMDPTTHVGSGTLLPFGGYGSAYERLMALTVTVSKGGLVLTVGGANTFTGYSVGDTINVGSDKIWPWSDHFAKIGELAKIVSKTTTTITLDRPLADDYATGDNAIVQRVKSTPVGAFSVRNLTFVNSLPGTHNNGFLRVSASDWPEVRQCDFVGQDGAAVDFNGGCDGFRADDLRFFDGNDEPDRAGYAYGVVFSESACNGIVTNLYGRRVRHMVTNAGGSAFYGIPRDIVVDGGIGEQCTNATWDTHAEGERIHIRNVVSRNGRAFGYDMRAPRSTLHGFESWDSKGPGLLIRAFDSHASNGRIYRPRTAVLHLVAGDSPGSSQPGVGVHVTEMTTWSWGGGDPETQPPTGLSVGDPSTIRDVEVIEAETYSMLIADGVSNLDVENFTSRRSGAAAIKGTGTWSGARFKGTVIDAPTGFGWDLAATCTDVAEEGTRYRNMGAALRWNSAGFRPLARFRRYETEPGPTSGVVLPDSTGYALGTVSLTNNPARWCRFRPKKDIPCAVVAFAVATLDTTDESIEVAFYDVTANPAAPVRIATTGAVSGKLNAGATNAQRTLTLPFTLFEAGRDYAYLVAGTDVGSTGDTDGTLVCANFSNLSMATLLGTAIDKQRFGTRASTAAGSAPSVLTVDAAPNSVSIPIIGLLES